MECEWDDEKASSNLAKHGVSFEEASTVFDDALGQYFDDPRHSDDDTRAVVVGYSENSRLMVVSYTLRGKLPRIISARRATSQERQNHERRTNHPRRNGRR